jgi:DNA-directed DNA polymerase III PolC
LRYAFGKLDQAIDIAAKGEKAIALTDRNSTYGHIKFQKICKDKGIKAIFGVELGICEELGKQKTPENFITFIARTHKGLKQIYSLVALATEQFYYTPRLCYADLKSLDDQVIVLAGNNPLHYALKGLSNIYQEVSPSTQLNVIREAQKNDIPLVATSDNQFLTSDQLDVYQVTIGMPSEERVHNQYLIDEYDWTEQWNEDWSQEALGNCNVVSDLCEEFEIPMGEMVRPQTDISLEEMAWEGFENRNCPQSSEYRERMKYELDLIKEKGFEDYFIVVADMINYAKQHMLVGPARGSSAGSLVCYCIGVVDVDPIPYDLLFERFISIERVDPPDIDTDFQDNKRYLVEEYLANKYGADKVARLGTVSYFKAKSTITDAAKALGIPQWEVSDLKDSIIERSGGDSRSNFCIMDTFAETDIGKEMLEKYPELKVTERMEGHARHAGQHAAGVLVTKDSIANYCSIDMRTGAAQIDKYDAEALDLLKIDALGLRTLTIVQETLDQIGWSRQQLLDFPLDYQPAYDILNNKRFTGIFQFSGFALISLCSQFTLENFNDIVSVTALARPGPLSSGMANLWIDRRNEREEISYPHESLEPISNDTLGVIMYQEQIMRIAREIGGMDWQDVSALRKAMSKSLGKEFFDKFWDKFKIGAKEKGLPDDISKELWDQMNTFGSWCFNKSHAVSYGLVSYWTLLLKAKFPVEFAASTLRHAKDDEEIVKLLRELTKEGYQFKTFDYELSDETWSVKDGMIIGGLMNIKGIGPKLASDIVSRRKEGKELTARQDRLLRTGETPYDKIFEGADLWSHIYNESYRYGIISKLTMVENIDINYEGELVFIAKIVKATLRDLNELVHVEKRDGKRLQGQTLYINMTVEDDTDSIMLSINNKKYIAYGKPIIESGKTGEWYLWKGWKKAGFRKVYTQRNVRITDNPKFECK